MGAFPVLKGEGLSSSDSGILGKGEYLGGYLCFLSKQIPGLAMREAALPDAGLFAHASAGLQSLSEAVSAGMQMGNWAEGQEFKNLFYSRQG